MHQLRVGPHDLPSAHIAILRQQLPIHSGREDRGDGKAPLKLASPYAAGFLLPCVNQPVQGLHAKERLVPGEEQATVALPAGGQPQPQTVALSQLRLRVQQHGKACRFR